MERCMTRISGRPGSLDIEPGRFSLEPGFTASGSGHDLSR